VKAEDIESVRLLGIEGRLEWRQDYEGLHVTMPDKRPCDHAYTLKVALRQSVAASQ
jgi:alpha-L-fucosidase